MRTVYRMFSLCLVVFAVLFMARPVLAETEASVIGRWNGFGVVPGPMVPPSASLDIPPGPCFVLRFDVFTQNKQALVNAALPGLDKVLTGNVRVGQEDKMGIRPVDFIGTGRNPFKVHGTVRAIGGTQVIYGDCSYTDKNGGKIYILIGLLRNLDHAKWTEVPAPSSFRDTWLGQGTDDGNPGMDTNTIGHKMSLTLGNQMGSQANGHTSFFDVFLPAVQMPADSFFDVFATIGEDGHIVMLGHERLMNIWVLCDGSVRNADNILFGDGSVRGIYTLFTVEQEEGGIDPCIFISGRFNLLPAVQRGM